MSSTPNLIDGTLYVPAVNADGTEYEGGAEPFPLLDEWDL